MQAAGKLGEPPHFCDDAYTMPSTEQTVNIRTYLLSKSSISISSVPDTKSDMGDKVANSIVIVPTFRGASVLVGN